MKHTKQILAFVAMMVAVFFTQAKDIPGNNELKKDAREVAPFEQVIVNADFDIAIDYAIMPKVEVEAESNLQEYIITEVKGKALNISVAKKATLKNNMPIVIRISLPSLSKFQMEGNGKVEMNGIPSDKMEMAVAGEGSVNIKSLRTSSLKLTAEKKSQITFNEMAAESIKMELKNNTSCSINNLAGAKKIELTASTSEACTFTSIQSESFIIKENGKGTINITGLTGKEIKATLPNSGDITVSGTVENVEVKSTGAANFDALTVTAQKAKIENGGSGDISVSAASSLEANITSSGSVNYKGVPKIKIENTGTGQLVKKF